MMKSQRNGGTRDGFTLIEVLMAAFIIALGVLGLSALFAGAARQQQVATQTTSAVVVSNNAEAIVARNFGSIDGPGFVGAGSPMEGVWYPVPIPNTATGNNYSEDNYLSIDAADNGVIDGTVYFLVDEPQGVVLMEWPQRQDLDAEYRVANNADRGRIYPRGVSERAFPHGRIEPTSLAEVRVILGPTSDTSDEPDRVLYFSYVHGSDVRAQVDGGSLPTSPDQGNALNDWGTLPSNADDPDDPSDDERLLRLFPNGQVNYSNYIVIDAGLGPDAQRLYTDPEPARILAMNIGTVRDVTGLQIRRVEVTSYKWRNDRLISLEDRIVSKVDVTSASGRRPDIGYSLLYRRFNTGASQIGIFTYQLTPVDGTALRPTGTVRPGEPLFVPKERNSELASGAAPVRLATGVDLAYDNVNKNYYISVPQDNEDVRWVAEPGQLLVVAQRANDSQLTNRRTGSDLPVRVLRKSTLANGRIRADLDRVPRAEGESMLPDLTQTENISVWAIQETVKSRRSNATWKLSPLDFRVIQVR